MNIRKRGALALFAAFMAVSLSMPVLASAQTQDMSVMIIGSSLVRGIKPYLKQLLKQRGVPKPHIVGMGAPGWNLATHAASGRTERKLNGTEWDFVIMAGESDGLEEDAAWNGAIAMHAKVVEAGAQPVVLLTWLPKVWPMVVYDTLLNDYRSLASQTDTPLAPAGWAVREVAIANDPVGLWARSTHLSKLGRYLVTAVIYETITGESIVGKWAPKSFDDNAVTYLQNLANEIVFIDPGLAYWNIN
jgi:hypothetical protein